MIKSLISTPSGRIFNRALFHHYGYVSTNVDESFRLLRISKNASTAVVSQYRLNVLKRFDEIPCSSPITVITRDPYLRFKSSIVETIKRGKLYQDYNYYGDIILNPEIFNPILDRLKAEDIEGLIAIFLELIDQYGPFDAHHEAQSSFLIDLPSNVRLSFINLSDLNNYLDVSNMRDRPVISNSRSGDVGARGDWAPLVKSKIAKYYYRKRVGPNTLLSGLSLSLVGRYDYDKEIERLLSILYHSIMSDTNFKTDIAALYRVDYESGF